MKEQTITIEKRTVYEGRRKRNVYDARCGQHCDCRCTAPSRVLARQGIEAEHKYVTEQPTIERGDCRLMPVGLNSWCFELRVSTRRGSTMMFSAATADEAYERVKSGYHDHPDAHVFLAD